VVDHVEGAADPWAEAVAAARTAVPVEVHGVDGPAAVG
jgi:hypothetical protein